MINGKDIYDVLAALVPLYVAMILAYASVRWWKIFSPEQCAGINRFVAVFAVPLLSFHFISSNNPYAMNFRFIAADSLQKVAILLALFLWKSFYKRGCLEWMITFFSLSTLPNTLVMGIPLLESMYGQFSGELMVQIVVLQSVIWYTLMLIMFEYRGAKLLISEQFPETAGKIASVRVDSDVLSLNGREILQADAEIDGDGKLHVVLRRSPAPSSRGLDSIYSMNSRAGSELSGVEIYSVPSSLAPTPRASSFKHGYDAGGDIFSPGSPNFEEETMKVGRKKKRGDGRSMSSSELFNNGGAVHPYPHPNPVFLRSSSGGGGMPEKQLHMFVWSSNASSPVSEGNMRHAVNTRAASADYGVVVDSSNTVLRQETAASGGLHYLSENIISHARKLSGERAVETEDGAKSHFTLAEEKGGNNIRGTKVEMPAASVMTRLILIMVWRKLIRNPNTYASLFGLAWSLISFRWHIKMPKIVSGSISILSDAGLGMAMFSLGLFMALQPRIIACGKSLALFAMAIRFLIGPAVIAATSAAISIRGDLFRVAIVQAALPQGIVPFVFAKEYNVHADILSTAVIFGMLVALPITILYYVLLGL